MAKKGAKPAVGAAASRDMLHRAKEFLRLEAQALYRLAQRLDDQICAVADLILRSNGIVVVAGVGKSGLVGEKLSATLASTGTRSITLDPTSALHGDLGRLTPDDILICLSNSGETEELGRLVIAAKRLGVAVIAITSNARSSLAQLSDVVVNLGPMREACPLGLAPTTTTTAQMAVGDALALVLLEQRGFTREHFARLHPAGSLGQRLTEVRELMRRDDRVPLVALGTAIKSALSTMYATSGRPGALLIVDGQRHLLGIFTERDLQGMVEQGRDVFGDPVESVMRRDPIAARAEAPVQEALVLFDEAHTEHLPVVDNLQQVVGLLVASDIPGYEQATRRTAAGPGFRWVRDGRRQPLSGAGQVP